MKTIIRIPTQQFAYIEFEFDGTPEDAIAEHNRILKLYQGGEGLPQKEWNAALDTYLKTNTLPNGTEIYAKMSPAQQGVFQELKKAFKRLEKYYLSENEHNPYEGLDPKDL